MIEDLISRPRTLSPWLRIPALALLLLLIDAATKVAAAQAAPRTVIVLMIDGLSGEMLDSVSTPNFARLRTEGAWTHDLVPVFPSISEPNWVATSTGCWPEHNGIVSGEFLDPQMGVFNHDVDARWLTGCDLLQQVAERQGVKTAALGWWGRFSKANEATASYVSPERKVPWDPSEYASEAERTAAVIRYLQMPDESRPRLILAYFVGPDIEVHLHGIDSPQGREAIVRADTRVGVLMDAIDRLPYKDNVTLVISSDHGHVRVSHLINFRRVLRRRGISARDVTTGTTSFLYFADASEIDRAFEELSRCNEFDVFRRAGQPSYAHLGTSPRVGDLIVSAHPDYYMVNPELAPWYLKPLAWWGHDIYPSPYLGAGLRSEHGYPPDTPGVHGILYATGAGVPRGRRIKSARMIDIHPTVTHLLGIKAGSPVDGLPIAEF